MFILKLLEYYFCCIYCYRSKYRPFEDALDTLMYGGFVFFLSTVPFAVGLAVILPEQFEITVGVFYGCFFLFVLIYWLISMVFKKGCLNLISDPSFNRRKAALIGVVLYNFPFFSIIGSILIDDFINWYSYSFNQLR